METVCDGQDSNNNFVIDEGCYVWASSDCTETDSGNDPTIGGATTAPSSAAGQSWATQADRCIVDRYKWGGALEFPANPLLINETTCLNMQGLYFACPTGTTCSDPDGPAGDTPAVCQ